MRVYLAGPMTGIEGHNFPAFEAAAHWLRLEGNEVISPRELSGATEAEAIETPWEAHLRRDLAAMLGCEAVFVLDGWASSAGAKLEVATALSTGIPVFDMHGQELRLDSASLDFEMTGPADHQDERVVDPDTGAVKADGGKARMDLLPVRPLMDVGRVMEFGARKYAPRNWELGFDWSRPYGAALRHLFQWWDGEDLDQETGLPHLAHALCCVLFLAEYEHTRAGRDDRPGKETA